MKGTNKSRHFCATLQYEPIYLSKASQTLFALLTRWGRLAWKIHKPEFQHGRAHVLHSVDLGKLTCSCHQSNRIKTCLDLQLRSRSTSRPTRPTAPSSRRPGPRATPTWSSTSRSSSQLEQFCSGYTPRTRSPASPWVALDPLKPGIRKVLREFNYILSRA